MKPLRRKQQQLLRIRNRGGDHPAMYALEMFRPLPRIEEIENTEEPVVKPETKPETKTKEVKKGKKSSDVE